jgi:hypothetical protein
VDVKEFIMWVLIIIGLLSFHVNGVVVSTQEFTTFEKCQNARIEIGKQAGEVSELVRSVCVEK